MTEQTAAAEGPEYVPGGRCQTCDATLYTDLEAWYRAYKPRLCRYVAAKARQAGAAHIDVEDIAHDAYVNLRWVLGWVKKPGAWLNTVARRSLNKEADRDKATGADIAAIEQAGASIQWTSLARTSSIETLVATRLALQALQALPNRQAVVTHLFWVQGWTHKEIGEYLGIATSTVSVTMKNARDRISIRHLDAKNVTFGNYSNAGDSYVSGQIARVPAIMMVPVWVWCPCWSTTEPAEWQTEEQPLPP